MQALLVFLVLFLINSPYSFLTIDIINYFFLYSLIWSLTSVELRQRGGQETLTYSFNFLKKKDYLLKYRVEVWFKKFAINKVNSEALHYNCADHCFNSFFKWSPLSKRTSYFGLYIFSKNK